MTPAEKYRLYEILFYLYFNRQDDTTITNQNYWNLIKSICDFYGVNMALVSKALRILSNDDNKPNELEIVYLLNKAGVSVRPLNKISGIYWQKQKAYLEEIASKGVPYVFPRITDTPTKVNIDSFIKAMYNIGSIFNILDQDLIM
jgi:hypothetical protein